MKRVFLASTFLLASTLSFAQSQMTGTVQDANGEPLAGVSVMEVGTKNGVVSDINGHYSIQVKPGAKLKVSYLGFTPQTVPVQKGKVILNIKRASAPKGKKIMHPSDECIIFYLIIFWPLLAIQSSRCP